MSKKNTSKKINKIQAHQKEATQDTNISSVNKQTWYILAIILITTFIIYIKAINFNILFSWDDQNYITDNKEIKNLNWSNIKLYFTNFYVANYQPLSILTYAFDHLMSGEKGTAYHLNNILLHLLNTFLVFVFIRKLSPKSMMGPLITAAFFAVHPMHVESVAWISERKDVLYSFFFLLALIKYSDYLKFQKTKYLIFTGAFFILSCLSKSAAVILPLIMLLMDYYTNRKFNWKTLFEKAPFFIISLVFGIIAISSQDTAIEGHQLDLSAIQRLSLLSNSFITYLLKVLLPVDLSALYIYPLGIEQAFPLKHYFSILFVGLILFLVVRSLKWGKDVAFGFLFFLISIILVLQIVQVGAASMADRYTYIPYIGIFFMIGKLYEYISSNKVQFKKHLSIVLIIGFFIFSGITYTRLKVWENDETLFSDMINKYPNNIPYFGRGLFYLNYNAKYLYIDNKVKREFYTKKAISDLENALEFPTTPEITANIYCTLGSARNDMGDYANAILDLNKSIELKSKNVEYLPLAYYERADSKFSLQNFNEALTDFNKSIELNSRSLLAWQRRGDTKLQLMNFIGAIEDYTKVIALNPKDPVSYTNRGIAKNKMKDFAGGIKDFDTAILINAESPDAYYNRAFAKYFLNNYEAALADFNKVIELNPQYPNGLNYRDAVKMKVENSKKKS